MRSFPQLPFGIEVLEPRVLMSVNQVATIPDLADTAGNTATVVDLSPFFDDPDVLGTVVRFDTVMGSFYAELFDVASGNRTAAPDSVAHFLNHVNNNLIPGSSTRYSSYDNTLIHRVDTSNGVIQGGAFAYPGFGTLPAGPTVNNEFSETRPNTRGTIGWAKQAGNPNSATNQWFINTKDNSTAFGSTNNGGFTTFGQVLGSGMTIVDAILALPSFNATSLNPGLGTQFPLRNTPPVVAGPDNVVLVRSVRQASELIFTASSSNTALANPSTDGTSLLFNLVPGQTGTATITVRATDHTGAFTEGTFELTVGPAVNPPMVEAVRTAARVVRGGKLNLVANGVADVAGGTITRVEFYHDANGNGILEPGVDTLLATDDSPVRGWTARVDTAGIPGGNRNFFARAVDNSGESSPAATAAVDIRNIAPTFTRMPNLAYIQRNQPGTLSYNLFAALGNARDANGDPIRFRVDEVFSGTLTKGGQAVVPGQTTLGPGESLVWTPAPDADGTLAMFSLRAFDGEQASARPVTVRLVVNKPPVVSRVVASPAPLIQPGAALTLTAVASDPDGRVASMAFYRDSNNNGTLETATDQLLGQDTSPRDGFRITTASTTGFPLGDVRYFAVASDDRGGRSAPLALVAQVHTPPTLGALTTSAPVARPNPITLTLASAAVSGAGVTVRKVEFFFDADSNGQVGADDTFLGFGQVQEGGSYALTVSTEAIPAGQVNLLARVTDSVGAATIATATAELTAGSANPAPTIDALLASAAVVNRGGTFTLIARGVDDPGGRVQRLEFYRDNGDGVFSAASDTLVARDFSPAGGWKGVTTLAANFTTGERKFFVRALDFDGNVSDVKEVSIIVNPPPTIGSVSAPATVTRGAVLTITAENVADTLGGSVRRVEFYHDTNNNGFFDAADRRLGIDANAAGGFLARIQTRGFSSGTHRFFVRALDNNGTYSSTTSRTVIVI